MKPTRKSKKASKVKKLLHVVTDLHPGGGIFHLLSALLRFQTDVSHSFFQTSVQTPFPPSLRGAADLQLQCVDKKTPLECAQILRDKALDFDLVLLHLHVTEILPFVAFGKGYGGPPVALVDHADQRPWIGSTFLDARLVFRKTALRLSERRGLDPSRSLQIPMVAFNYDNETKEEIREDSEMHRDNIVVLSVGKHHHYANSFTLLDLVLPILKELRHVQYTAIGAPREWEERAKPYLLGPGQLKVLDSVEPERLLHLQTLADIHLDTFPLSSATYILESVMSDAAAIGFCPWAREEERLLCAETQDFGDPISQLLKLRPMLSCHTAATFRKAFKTLVSYPRKNRQYYKWVAGAVDLHSGVEWSHALNSTYSKILQLPRRPERNVA